MTDTSLKSYLLTIDTTKLDRKDAIDAIDAMKNIVNWRTLFKETIMLISADSLLDLHEQMKAAFPEKHFIIVSLDGAKKNGWLARKSWDFMNDPKPAGHA